MPRLKPSEWPKLMDYTCSHESHEFDGEYEMFMRCGNCGYQFVGRFTRGHEALGTHKCPRCGCGEARLDAAETAHAREAKLREALEATEGCLTGYHGELCAVPENCAACDALVLARAALSEYGGAA